jgi:hypothetical protein
VEHSGLWILGKHRHTPILVFPARVPRVSRPRHTNPYQPHIAALQFLNICHRLNTLEILSSLVPQVQVRVSQLARWRLETFRLTPSTAGI